MHKKSSFVHFPTPTSSDQWEKDPNVVRNFLCRHYSRCLDTCIDQNWSGFSCGDCGAFSISDLKPWEWAQDAHNCALLMYMVTAEATVEAAGCCSPEMVPQANPATGMGESGVA